MNILIVTDSIAVSELEAIAKEFYYPLLKGVVDIEKEVVAFGGEWHMDANKLLMESGSSQQNVWGFNIFLDRPHESWLEYTSLINIRPELGNRSTTVRDETIRDKMKNIINSKII